MVVVVGYLDERLKGTLRQLKSALDSVEYRDFTYEPCGVIKPLAGEGMEKGTKNAEITCTLYTKGSLHPIARILQSCGDHAFVPPIETIISPRASTEAVETLARGYHASAP